MGECRGKSVERGGGFLQNTYTGIIDHAGEGSSRSGIEKIGRHKGSVCECGQVRKETVELCNRKPRLKGEDCRDETAAQREKKKKRRVSEKKSLRTVSRDKTRI